MVTKRFATKAIVNNRNAILRSMKSDTAPTMLRPAIPKVSV